MSSDMKTNEQLSLFHELEGNRHRHSPEDIVLQARRMQGLAIRAGLRAIGILLRERVVAPVVFAYRQDGMVDLLNRLDDARLKDIGTRRADLGAFVEKHIRRPGKRAHSV